MPLSRCLRLFRLAVLWLTCGSTSLVAQLPRVPEERLGVDVLHTRDGQRLYGFLIDESEASLQLAVEVAWLRATYPTLADQQQRQQQDNYQASRKRLIQRIDDWIEERRSDEALIGFLQSERERIEKEDPTSITESKFFVLDLPRDSVRQLTRQTEVRRQIAGIAYMHDLPDVVSTPTNLLQKSLEKMQVDIFAERVDLTDELPRGFVPRPRHAMGAAGLEKSGAADEQQWAARQALVEFQLRQSPEYQGTGDRLFRSGQVPALAELLPQLLGGTGLDEISQLGAELGLPEFAAKPSATQWWQKVVESAERDGFRGVLIVRLKPQPLAASVAVEASFFAKQGPGRWFQVARFVAESRGDQQPAERIERLRQDPQIKQVVDLLGTFGVAATDRLDAALRQGAATDQALQNAKSQFSLFLGKQIRALDGPAIALTP